MWFRHPADDASVWGAHAPRVFFSAPSPKSSFCLEEDRGEAPRSAREARALPRTSRTSGSSTSCIKVDFPDPEIPVITDKRATGNFTSMLFRLFARAFLISTQPATLCKLRRDLRMGWQSGVFRQRPVSES